MRNLGALALVFLCASLAHAQVGWVGLPSLQTARQETAAVCLGDRIFVMGGLLAGFPFTATPTVEVLDFVAGGGWSFAAPLPVGLDHAAAAAIGGTIYVFGGFSGDFTPRADVYAYDPVADTWSTRAPLPSPRGAAWAAVHGGKAYLFGGTGPGGDSAATFAYDPGDDSWTARADMPTAREHLNAATIGEFIYVVGGRSGSAFATNERYHPATDTWVGLAPMSAARSAMGLAAFRGRLYAAGGEIPMLFDLFEVYDPPTNAWTSLPPMPIPRHGVAAVAIPDRIVFPAGGIVQGLLPTDAADAYVPAPAPAVPALPPWGIAAAIAGLGTLGLRLGRARTDRLG